MFTEVQQAMVDLIATRLRDGIVHPGDPDRDIPATPIALPFRPMPGQPKEMSALLEKTAELLSEALISTIVVDGDIELMPRAEARTLRRAAGEGATGLNVVPVHCRCDKQRQDPLAILTFSDPDCVVVDGPTVLRGLHARGIDCPHERVD